MNRIPETSESLEALIAEAMLAESAGVFKSTPVDAQALLHSPSVKPISRSRLFRLSTVGLQMAACLMVGLLIHALWRTHTPHTTPHSDPLFVLHPQPNTEEAVRGPPQVRSLAEFAHCYTGPNASVPVECSPADFDGDGDVDLHDLQAFQLACGQQPVRG